MAYSTYSDVRMVIDTELEDSDITSLIVISDAEIDARAMNTRATNIKKGISVLLTCEWIAKRDPYSRSTGEYRETRMSPMQWRAEAEKYIQRTSPSPYLWANDPLPWE